MIDRTSRPKRIRRSVDTERAQHIERLRHERIPVLRVARIVGRNVATIGRVLVEHGQSRVKAHDPQGVFIERLVTDSKPAYRSHLFARTCQALVIKHTFTLAWPLQLSPI